jgi:uncharacterized membrane protein YhaH (DUF805 family)
MSDPVAVVLSPHHKEHAMNFQDAVRTCLTKYVVSAGRAGRAEFWYFFLFNVIVSVVMGIIDAIIGTQILGGLVSLALLLPNIMVGIRRLHDTNRSGWWMLIGLIPVVGWIILIVFFVQPGDSGPNQHGPAPAPAAATAY